MVARAADDRSRLRLYHGGALNAPGERLWATPDPAYAAAFAQLYEADLWALTVDLREHDILDLTACGFNARVVAAVLTLAGLLATCADDEAQHPHCVVRRLTDEAIMDAGYRAIGIHEWIDWGHERVGPVIRHAVSVCLVDLGAIVERRAMKMSRRNFHLPMRT
jgi:hypothetical protein